MLPSCIPKLNLLVVFLALGEAHTVHTHDEQQLFGILELGEKEEILKTVLMTT